MRPTLLALASLVCTPLLALSSCSPSAANAAERVAEHLVTLQANSLPEFKTNLHNQASEGNLISGVVRVVHEDQRGWIWFGTQNGLARHDGDSLVYFDLRDVRNQPVTVRALAEDAAGNVWIGSAGGLTKYDGAFFTSYTEADGLVSDGVWCLNVDTQGLLWVGTEGGACTFDGATFTRLDLPKGVRDPNRGVSTPSMVRSITNARSGGVWIIGEGLVLRQRGDRVEPVEFPLKDAPNFISSLLEDSRGDLWIATTNAGVWKVDGKEAHSMTASLAERPLEAGQLFEDSRGNIWFPVEGIGLCRVDGDDLSVFENGGGLDLHAIFLSAEDHLGRMWFCGFGGVVRYDGDRFVKVTRDGPW